MTAFIAAVALELLLLLMVLPLGVQISFRFSLDRKKCFVTVKILGIQAVKLTVEYQNGAVRTLVNGKERKKKKSGGRANLPAALRFVRTEKIVRGLTCLGVIGGEDASAASVNYGAFASFVCSLLPEADTSFVYPDFERERLDFDLTVHARISPVQAVRLASVAKYD